MNDQVYCSVDLEFTGFDPEKDQILEVGFAFFRMSESGAEIIEEWSQVFKPSIEVHPKILGLTGITLAELERAPKFEEHREFIQSKLGGAVILAHNPMMDVKFLEAYGIKLSGKTIDTLELVQFLLPTHHSYNLENLMHYFGIEHTEAHRALGDCRSTIAVLERLLRIYQSFDDQLKKEIVKLVSRGSFVWQSLLQLKLTPWQESGNDSLSHNFDGVEALKLSGKTITVDSEIVNHEARVAVGLGNSNSLLVVSESQLVMKLWRAGFVHGLFSSQDVFSESAFEQFRKRALTNEEIRFCLKVAVWLKTNWQTEVVLDLNISFFGGQFKSYITGGKQSFTEKKVFCCDYRTLRNISQTGEFTNRDLVICHLQDYEQFVSSSGPTYLSWNGLLYLLRSIYNPETGLGEIKLKDQVVEALTSTDLYFGLVYLLLHKSYPHNLYVAMPKVTEEQPQIALRLERAAENLNTKIKAVLVKIDSPELVQHSQFLEQFFQDKPGYIRWVTVEEHNTMFHDQPLDISDVAQEVFKKFKSVKLTETITQKDLLFYSAERLKLNTEATDFANNYLKLTNSNLTINFDSLDDVTIVEKIKSVQKPVVVVMDQPADIKNLYNLHFEELKKVGNLFAQGYSGGGNKMFRNFSIRKESILLATAEFIGRQSNLLGVGAVLVTEPPTIDSTHPYVAALLQYWIDRFPKLQSILELGKLVSALKKLSARPGYELQIYGLSGKDELQKLLSE